MKGMPDIVADHGADHLGLVLEALGEERTDRTVDQARNQGFLFRGPAFTLKKAAWNLTGGKGLLLVIDRQRKKVRAGAHGFLADRSAEHAGLAVGRQNGAVGLPGDPAGFEAQLTAAPLDFFYTDIEHVIRSFQPTPELRSPDPRKRHCGNSPDRNVRRDSQRVLRRPGSRNRRERRPASPFGW